MSDEAVMMGYGDCFVCRQPFTFNPSRVPSYQGEPVCRSCMDRVNAQRATMKLPPHPILPGAYEPESIR